MNKNTLKHAASILLDNHCFYVGEELMRIADESVSGEIQLMDENAFEKVVTWEKEDFIEAFSNEQVLFTESRYQEVLPDLKNYLEDHSNDSEAFQCIIRSHFKPDNAEYIKELWEEFGEIPMDPETECIETEWKHFPAGTHREDIWKWFEETYPVKVYDLLYHFEEFDDSFLKKDNFLKNWILSSYNKNTKEQLDYYLNPNACDLGDIAYLYSHEDDEFIELYILCILHWSDDNFVYDQLLRDKAHVLVEGENYYQANTSAEFISDKDSSLVWFRYGKTIPGKEWRNHLCK